MSPALASFKTLTASAVELTKADELKARLATGSALRIKLGFDPTAPALHLGHTVLLNRARQFQDLGHTVVIILGDFSARIGDPTGKKATRPVLSEEEIEHNTQHLERQLFKVLSRDHCEVHRNSEWFGSMSASDLLEMAMSQTVARLLERDDFAQRHKAGHPIALHEFFYPLLQGHDSLAISADLELGGTDQLFNLMVGRKMQERAGMPPQVVMTLPILEGVCSTQKMSKSLGNSIGLEDAPLEQVGQIMRIDDEQMWHWFALLTPRSESEVSRLRQAVKDQELHPREVKLDLARELVTRFHDEEKASSAIEAWQAAVRGQGRQEEIPCQTVEIEGSQTRLVDLLKQTGLATSVSDARRKIREGAVRLCGERVTSEHQCLDQDFEGLIQVGKRRFVRLRLQNKEVL